jgi:hypothetical protein
VLYIITLNEVVEFIRMQDFSPLVDHLGDIYPTSLSERRRNLIGSFTGRVTSTCFDPYPALAKVNV